MGSVESRQRRSTAVAAVGLYLLVLGLYSAGSATSFLWFNATAGTAVFFPPAGVTLAALVVTPYRYWPVVLAAAASGEVIVDNANDIAFDASLGYALANTVEPSIGALIVRRVASSPNLARVPDLLAFFAAITIAPAIGAVIGATNTDVIGPGTDWGDFWLSWWVGDGLGALAVGAMLITVGPRLVSVLAGTRAAAGFRLDDLGMPWRWTWLIPAVVGLSALVFQLENVPLLFLTISLFAAVPFLLGTLGVALTAFGMAFAIAFPTAYDHGFFEAVGVSVDTGLIYLQGALAFLIAGGLLLAAAFTERDRTMRELGRSEQERQLERELLDRTSLLQRMATSMGAAVTTAEVAQIAAVQTQAAFHARSAVLLLIGEDGEAYVAGGTGYEEAELEELRDRLADTEDRSPAMSAFESGNAIWVGDSGERPAALTAYAEPSATAGTALAVPLIHEGSVLGALLWGFDSRRIFDAGVRGLAQAVASQCALAIDRVRLSETEHRFARDVQSVMLPGAPSIDGLDVHAYYRPADPHLEVGGDWYDVTSAGEREVVIAVGDVVGRGLAASAAMGQLRSAASALAQATDGPAAVLDGLDRFAADTEAAMCSTVCCVHLNVDTGEIRYAAAGHPPPLVVHQGRIETLDGGRSMPLCFADGPRPEAATTLPAGAIVAIYTDGLVETRTEPIDVGIERLGTAIAELAGGAFEQAAEKVVDRTLEDRSIDDDVALVLLRRA